MNLPQKPKASTLQALKPLFSEIARQHQERKPAQGYDAWAAPTNSRKYKMRGQKNCETCHGMGFEFVDLGKDAFSWIRCKTCFAHFVTAREVENGKVQKFQAPLF